MYVNTAVREAGQDLAAFIKDEVGRFPDESPQLEVVEGNLLETFDKKLAQVRFLTGDRWCNHESVAYLAEANVFVIFVLTSRSGVEFRDSVPAFKALLKTYEFVTATPEDATDHFSVIKALAKDAAATPDGARYDKEHGRSFAQQHGAALRKCFETTPKADSSDFDILIRIADTGKPLDILIEPETNVAKCLRRSIEGGQYPPPPRPRYWVDVEMHIKP